MVNAHIIKITDTFANVSICLLYIKKFIPFVSFAKCTSLYCTITYDINIFNYNIKFAACNYQSTLLYANMDTFIIINITNLFIHNANNLGDKVLPWRTPLQIVEII